MAASRGSCRGRVLWHTHIYALSRARYAISCTPIRTLVGSSSKGRNTPSANQLHVSSFQVGRSVLNKDSRARITIPALVPLPNFTDRVETLGIYSILTTKSAATISVDTIKYVVFFFHSKRSKPFRGS